MTANEDRHRYFLETFRLLRSDKRKFIYRLNHHEFSVVEGRLLRGYLEFHRNSKAGALKELRVSPFSEPFYEGVRLYLVGLVYNQHSHFRYAVENLERSVQTFHSVPHLGFILNPLYLLILALGNRRELERMTRLLAELESIPVNTGFEKLQVLHCKILHALFTGETVRCLEWLDQAFRFKKEDLQTFEPHLLIIRVAALIKELRYEEALSILERYKKTASNAIVRANYAYIKALLTHLHRGAPLYIYASKFKDFPELHWQLETVKLLSIGDLNGARKHWNQLRKHNPGLYGPDFEYRGEPSLFSQCLDRYRAHTRAEEVAETELDAITSKRDRLHYLLTRSSAPIQADRLVKLIWGEEADEKTLARLRKLISNYCKEQNVQVISSHYSYRLVRQTGETK
jgi:tetratricopeptide (TPR) repeat protein